MIEYFSQILEDSSLLLQLVGIFLIASIPFLEIYVAVPIGAMLRLPIILVVIMSIFGNALTVMAVILFSERLMQRKKERKAVQTKVVAEAMEAEETVEVAEEAIEKEKSFMAKRMDKGKVYFNKYGIPGIAFLGPLVTGYHLGALVSVITGGKKSHIIFWQMASIILWAIGIGVLMKLGIDIFFTK